MLLILFLPSISFAQLYFTYLGKDTLEIIDQNVLLVRKLEKLIYNISEFDGEKEINIPIAFTFIHAKKYFQEKNHVCEYEYDIDNDKITYGDNDVIVVTIDFDKKKISKKYEKGNEKDHYKPKDKDDKIKEKEKEKIKSTKVGDKIIVK